MHLLMYKLASAVAVCNILLLAVTNGLVADKLHYYSSRIILSLISWQIGSYIARQLIAWLMPRISSQHKIILITGCDSGFGYESALNLNRHGFYVYATCLDPTGPGGRSLSKAARYPDRMAVVKMDITKQQDIDEVYEMVKGDVDNNNGTLYGLLNNAAIPRTGYVEWGNFDRHFRELFEVNAIGPVAVTRTFLPLIRQSQGRIVIMSSTAGRYATVGHGAYSMAKASMVSFAETLRREVKRFNVKVILITPMFYRTNIINSDNTVKLLEKMWNTDTPKEIRSAYGERFFKACIKAIRYVLSSSVVEEKLDGVVNSIEDAFRSPYPNLTYVCCSSLWMRLHYWAYANFYPQEICELLSDIYGMIINLMLRFGNID